MIYDDQAMPGSFVLMSDPDYRPGESEMLLRLTYEGKLLGANKNNTRADHKHDLRKCFHRQLKRHWAMNEDLRVSHVEIGGGTYTSYEHYVSGQFQRNGYQFIPLVTKELTLSCAISILMLRPDPPGTMIASGDLDNRLKTIFDALRLPDSAQEFGGHTVPAEDETPFHCLLEDDRLITHVAVETDVLLQPVSNPPDANDTRLVIKIELRPLRAAFRGLLFN